jgi:predicted nucleic acid-binding protein
VIVADTSVWISYFKQQDPDLRDLLSAYLKSNDVYAVSAVFGELLQGVKNKKERSLIEFFWELLPKVDETELFLRAGLMSNEHKLYAQGVGFTDCFILAAALENNFALWTLDKKLGTMANEIAKSNKS